jgi:hypothetical protein
MLRFSPHVCTTHCEGQCYGKDADRVRHLERCAAQSLVRVVQVNLVTILALHSPHHINRQADLHFWSLRATCVTCLHAPVTHDDVAVSVTRAKYALHVSHTRGGATASYRRSCTLQDEGWKPSVTVIQIVLGVQVRYV